MTTGTLTSGTVTDVQAWADGKVEYNGEELTLAFDEAFKTKLKTKYLSLKSTLETQVDNLP